MRRLLAVSVVLLFPWLVIAQNPSGENASALNPPPEQTARQALIEMFFGDAKNHLEKHLPDVTRKSFHKLGTAGGQDMLAELNVMSTQAKAMGAAFQTFDTGPTLMTVEDPREKDTERVEITVERDDLIGDEDQIELGLHMTQNGKEDTSLPFVPRFTFIMKMESEVWRLNEITVTARLPLTDPGFLKGIEDRQRSQNEQMTMWAVREVNTAERAYESKNGTYACTLSGLAGSGKRSEEVSLYDPQLASGKKNGYIFAISGCDGSHYRIVAEPAMADSGQRAFCSDEDGVIRAAADGKATTCLSSGENVQGTQPDFATGAMAANQGTTVETSTPSVADSAQAAKVPTVAVQRVRVSAGVSEAMVISKVQPLYPPEAKSANVQGQVVMRAVISRKGDVNRLQILSGDPRLNPAALDAVKPWKYRPYLLNGNPVEVDTQVTVNFTLSAN